MNTTNSSSRGITLLDVLVSVVVLGIIASITLPDMIISRNSQTDHKNHQIQADQNRHHSELSPAESGEPSEKTGDDLKTVSLSPSDRSDPRRDGL